MDEKTALCQKAVEMLKMAYVPYSLSLGGIGMGANGLTYA